MVTEPTPIVSGITQGSLLGAIGATISFHRCVLYFMRGGSYKECPFFGDKLQVMATQPLGRSSLDDIM